MGEDGEFLTVRGGRSGRGNPCGLRPGNHSARGVRPGTTAGRGGLRGAQRVRTKCFFVSGLSPDCTVDEVVDFCRDQSVNIIACYLLRSRAWGTLSAKIFVAEASCEAVVKADFWPEHVRCRRWKRSPPRGRKSSTHSDGEF